MSVYKHTNTNNTQSLSWESLVVAVAHPSMSLMRLHLDKSAEAFLGHSVVFFMLTLITTQIPGKMISAKIGKNEIKCVGV